MPVTYVAFFDLILYNSSGSCLYRFTRGERFNARHDRYFVNKILFKKRGTVMEIKDRIIVALDVDRLEKAESLITSLSPYVSCFKVGLELLTAVGAPKVVEFVHSFGGLVFYDGKFNDIPHTVGRASKSVAGLNVKMFNVHAASGVDALAAAVANKGSSLVLAVTVLTSLDENNTNLVFSSARNAKVLQFARDAVLAGCDGIVCSAKELEFLNKQKELIGLLKVTPGTRPLWAPSDDQKQIMTPAEAIRLGAIIVVGRPITNPPKEIGTPVEAIKKISEEIAIEFLRKEKDKNE